MAEINKEAEVEVTAEVEAEVVEIPKPTIPTCVVCQRKKSFKWRRNMKGEYTCSRCVARQVKNAKPKRPPPRKSTRARSARNRQAKAKEIFTAKGRRTLLFKKKRPKRALIHHSGRVTTECLVYNNKYYQVGDVVSMIDKDGHIKYGQIHGLMVDGFGEKSAYLTWLKRVRGGGFFNPTDFVFDVDDVMPRKLSHLTYLSRYPLSLFKKNLPFAESKHPTQCNTTASSEKEIPSNLVPTNIPTKKLLRQILW